MNLSRRVRPQPLLLGACLLLGLTSCGQKGPLYLPDPKPQAVPAAPDTPADTPATRKAPRTPDPAAQR